MTYDYECTKCKNTYTITRSVYETEVLPVCVGCHESMTRVWSATTFIPSPGMYSYENKK